MSRVNETQGGLRYITLDDLKARWGEEMMDADPVYDNMIDRFENAPGGKKMVDHLDLFRLGKRCFTSINWDAK